MRVTNSMIYGNSMNNIWRSARNLNNLVTQLETHKKIQRPSDDPLLASRSLRYRTILTEAEQFIRNTQQGMAWMEVSEAAFNSILTGDTSTESLMHRIYVRLVEGAQTGTNTIEDQRAILSEITQFFDQMFSIDMNQTYLGRYVFSGFHTDQPPVLKNDWPGRSFIVTQQFDTANIERTSAFHKANQTAMPEKININVIKLPYTGADFNFDSSVIGNNAPAVGITFADGTQATVRTITSNEFAAYRPGDIDGDGRPIIHHISDTGELIMSNLTAELFADGASVTYEVRDLVAGELNPIVYFPSAEIVNNPDYPAAPGDPPVPERVAVHYDVEGQNIQMEISPNSYITINSHARNILTANLYSDLRRLIDFADSLIPSDPRIIEEYFRSPPHFLSDNDLEEEVQEHLSEEESRFASAMHDRMNNMLEQIMLHAAQAQREHTNMGSRMARLEMVSIRLEEDETAYIALLSKNDDVDLHSTALRKNNAEIAFERSLKAIATSVQLTLANFINR